MFPLNDQPEGLPALLERFENGEATYRFVRRHLHCGAQVSLSFVQVHYPEVDMELVKTLPPTPSGHTEMTLLAIALQIILQHRSLTRVTGRGPFEVCK
jgi:hypothetical protein